jgi:hypothetical protein
MWSQVQKMLQPNAASSGNAKAVPVIPLGKSAIAFDGLDIGKTIRFSGRCPLPLLTSATAHIIAVRLYRFGDDSIKSYQLAIEGANHYFLTVAEDEQGQYLALSRALNEAEQDSWFGRDALGFFTEQSSAKSIRCKADLMIEGEWAAARYSKTIDWVEGTSAPAQSPRLARSFHYNLLVNEAGDKALEIEHDDVNGENRIFVTTYRPIEDIAGIDLAPTPVAAPEQKLAVKEPFKDATPASEPAPQPKQRQDFRRLEEGASTQIHIERTPATITAAIEVEESLPSFLLSRGEEYLSLDHVIPPESEKVRVSVGAARSLIEQALRKNVRVRDILRDMLGLESALADEVIFEMPMTDADYRTLAMRYKLRPDHRVEIRSRLEEELRQKLTGIAKP